MVHPDVTCRIPPRAARISESPNVGASPSKPCKSMGGYLFSPRTRTFEVACSSDTRPFSSETSPAPLAKYLESGSIPCRLDRQFRCDFGDIPADLLNLLLASCLLHVADDGLGGEHRGAQQVDFRFGVRPFSALQGLHREFDHEFVR